MMILGVLELTVIQPFTMRQILAEWTQSYLKPRPDSEGIETHRYATVWMVSGSDLKPRPDSEGIETLHHLLELETMPGI